MNEKVTLYINCDAVGKGRPRFSSINGRVIAYTPKKTIDQENLIRSEFVKQCGMDKALHEGSISIFIIVGYKIPKSKSKKEKLKMLSNGTSVNKKPDLDNVVKLVLDALNGYAFKDDSQVCIIEARKRWMEKPQTIIEVVYFD